MPLLESRDGRLIARLLTIAWVVAMTLGACGGRLANRQQFAEGPANVGTQSGAQADGPTSGTTQLPLSPLRSVADAARPSVVTSADSGPMQGSALNATVDAGARGAGPPGCVTKLFSLRCDGSDCHGGGSRQLDLISAGVQERLVDRPSLPSLACAGRVYISTYGSPSLLLEKVAAAPTCGTRMPPSMALHKPEMKCLLDWATSLGASELDAGAP